MKEPSCSVPSEREVLRHTIQVGMRDADTRRQEAESKRILRLVNFCCKNYGLSYSCVLQTGGYFHADGAFVNENSIALTFLDQDPQKINELAKDISCFLNQESVLITVDKVVCHSVSERLERPLLTHFTEET